uniref:Lamin tail domain containing 1 n=1 Tax=Molossus molossus TaxID=27622 RepID=A0A7J8FYI6_MOLMO|nr:lamin tail domain containing 1 [Molossus molossus]
MKDLQVTQETSTALQSQVPEQEEKMEKQTQREDMHAHLSRIQQSLVHFFPKVIHSGRKVLPLSQSSSSEILLTHYLPCSQISGLSLSTTAPKSSKSTTVSHFQSESTEVNSFIGPNNKTPSFHDSEPAMIGDGEDYFLSLFGDSEKLNAQSSLTNKKWKPESMSDEDVGQDRSSAIGDIQIADVKDLFVNLINSSLHKELEIGNHILQQNMNGQTVSRYRFPPNITMQANCTVTVWAAASKAKHQPPSDFLWKEENKFSTNPNCTTILCKPNGEAIAWYTPIHWKQAWEKLDTDIELERCSIVSPTSQKHIFRWPKATTTSKEKHNQSVEDTSRFQMEPVLAFLKREKEVPPSLFPNHSPWCHSPNVPAHPYCPLIEPHITSLAECTLKSQPSLQPARSDPALRTELEKPPGPEDHWSEGRNLIHGSISWQPQDTGMALEKTDQWCLSCTVPFVGNEEMTVACTALSRGTLILT